MKIKGKIEVWVCSFIVAIIIANIGKVGSCISNAFEDNRESMTVGVFTDENSIIDNISSLGHNFKTYEEEGYVVTYSLNNMNTDVVISSTDLSSSLSSDYINIGNAHSPIILVGNDWVEDTTSFFNVVPQKVPGLSNDYNTYSCDFEDIVKAIETDKTWEDLGIQKKIIKGNVSLVIPKMNTIEGTYVWNYIYQTVQNMYPNKTNEEILEITNLIIGKSRQSSSIAMEFMDYHKNTTKSAYAFSLWLIPEHMVANALDGFSSDNSYNLYPIYLNKTNAIGYYVYARNDETFLTKFDTYAQEVIMEPLAIRYGNDNISKLASFYRHFKSIINYKTIFYDDLTMGKYEDILPKEGTPVVPVTNEQNSEEVIDEEIDNVEETTTEEPTNEIDENLQSKVDTSEEVSTSSLDEENENKDETINEEDANDVNSDEMSGSDVLGLVLIGIVLLVMFSPIIFMCFDCF
jgi:hypothetical protein